MSITNIITINFIVCLLLKFYFRININIKNIVTIIKLLLQPPLSADKFLLSEKFVLVTIYYIIDLLHN
jgi:hypothetical protein